MTPHDVAVESRAGCSDLDFRTSYEAEILPNVARALNGWTRVMASIPDPAWAELAIRNLERKKFHVAGASVFLLLLTGAGIPHSAALRRLVGLQIAVDLLDDLSDRGGIHDRSLVWSLHRFVLGGPRPETGTALPESVVDVLAQLRQDAWWGLDREPSYPVVRSWIRQTLTTYSRMQTISQLPVDQRDGPARRWADRHGAARIGLAWQEHQASHGSTVAAHLAMTLACRPQVTTVEKQAFQRAYEPWFHAIHIMLDSLNDVEEDAANGDLNFVVHLPSGPAIRERLCHLTRIWARQSRDLPEASFHRFVFRTMLGIYLGRSRPELHGRLLDALESESP